MLLWFVEKKIAPMDLDPSSSRREGVLRDCGLTHVAGNCKHAMTRGDTPGPSGGRGTVIGFSEKDLPAEQQLAVKYSPETQEWVKCAGGKYWCGRLRGEEIAPESLRRADGVPGFRVKLSDRNDWEVAKAVHQNGRKSLTRRLSLDGDGKVLKGGVIERFTALDEEAGKFFTAWMLSVEEERATEYLLDDLIRLAVLGLQANYRIGIDEAVSVLGLFDEENVWNACLATISWPSVIAMVEAEADAQKKTEEADIPNG